MFKYGEESKKGSIHRADPSGMDKGRGMVQVHIQRKKSQTISLRSKYFFSSTNVGRNSPINIEGMNWSS